MLVLHVPSGIGDLAAERAEIEEHIGPLAGASGVGYRIVVHALAGDSHLELKSLIAQPCLLELLTAESRTELRPFHGHITEASLLGSDGGLARYRLVIEPWLSFLGHGQDAYVFQDKSVIDIIEEIFDDYADQGRLLPDWRWELAEPEAYAPRSLCIQYQESDLEFITRLLREEGLFYWFEHEGDSQDENLGSHTLVIADHNAAFSPNPQETIRHTQAGATLPEDSITRWHNRAQLHTASLQLASHDYRSLAMRPQQEEAQEDAGRAPIATLGLSDVPGLYAYEDSAQGARLARVQMQALDALRAQSDARGTVRSAAPGTTFTLIDQGAHDGSDDGRDRFVILSAHHRVRNNIAADDRAHLESLLGAIDKVNRQKSAIQQSAIQQSSVGSTLHSLIGQAPERNSGQALANQSEEPLYQNDLRVQRQAVPVRMAGVDQNGLPDPRLHPRPTVYGAQSAIVIGTEGEPLHADRDHRIKVQFHWQRGSAGSHRTPHASGADNAPGDASLGTWVRVSTSVAGANWGSVFTPRVGQEVLVQFMAGDIDRPVVIGSLYNGQGSANAQGNQILGAVANATGNAAAWFPGSEAKAPPGQSPSGQLPPGQLPPGQQPSSQIQAQPQEGHQHAAVLSGMKSQELSTSQDGTGGHNQLVFDDSPAGNRIELGTSSAATRLQLGHLVHQSDNQRLQARGHGIDLSTAAWGAVRAGRGLLISAHGKPGSQSGSLSLDSREPIAQIEQSRKLLKSLADSAKQQQAIGSGDSAVEVNGAGAADANTATRDAPQTDPSGAGTDSSARPASANEAALMRTLKSLAQRENRIDIIEQVEPGTMGEGSLEDGSLDDGKIGGGTGQVTTWGRPDFVVAAPAGIASFSSASLVTSSGRTATLVAGQDIQLAARENHAWSLQSGLIFYTHGKASHAAQPNQATGLKLHAAAGNLNSQSQSGATRLTADQKVSVASTEGSVRVTALEHLLLTAGGAALDIQPQSITLKAPGKVEFKSTVKQLDGPGAAKQQMVLEKPRPVVIPHAATQVAALVLHPALLLPFPESPTVPVLPTWANLKAVTSVSIPGYQYALRSVRRGFLYLFFAKNRQGSHRWQVWNAEDGEFSRGADPLVGGAGVVAGQANRMPARSQHIVIDHPDSCGTTWLAFSEYRWSDDTLQQYASEEKLRDARMLRFEPTALIASNTSASRGMTPASATALDAVVDYAPDFGIGELPYDRAPARPKSVVKDTDGNYNRAVLEKRTTGYPWAKGRRGQASATLALMRSDGRKKDGSVHPGLVVALADPIGCAEELGGYKNTAASKVLEYGNELALQIGAANAIKGLQSMVDNAAGEDRKQFDKEFRSASELKRNPAEVAAFRARVATWPEQERKKQLEVEALLDDWAQDKLPLYLEWDLNSINRRLQEPERTRAIEALKKKAARIKENRRTSANANIQNARTHGWDMYEGHIDRPKLDAFNARAADFFATSEQLINVRTEALVNWLRAPALLDALEDFSRDNIKDGVAFASLIGDLTYGINSSPAGIKLAQEWISQGTSRGNLLWRAMALNQTDAQDELDLMLKEAKDEKYKLQREVGKWLVRENYLNKTLKVFADTFRKAGNVEIWNDKASEPDPEKRKQFGHVMKRVNVNGDDKLVRTFGERIFKYFSIDRPMGALSEKLIQHLFMVRAFVDPRDSERLIREGMQLTPEAYKLKWEEYKQREFKKLPPGRLPNAVRDSRISLVLMMIETCNVAKLMTESYLNDDVKSYVSLAASLMTLIANTSEFITSPTWATLNVQSWSNQSLKLMGGGLTVVAGSLMTWLDWRDFDKRQDMGQNALALVYGGKIGVGVVTHVFTLLAAGTLGGTTLAKWGGNKAIVTGLETVGERLGAFVVRRALFIAITGYMVPAFWLLTAISWALSTDGLEDWCVLGPFGKRDWLAVLFGDTAAPPAAYKTVEELNRELEKALETLGVKNERPLPGKGRPAPLGASRASSAPDPSALRVRRGE